MDDGDWRMGKNEYYLKNGDDAQPLSLQKIAEEFLAERFDYSDFPLKRSSTQALPSGANIFQHAHWGRFVMVAKWSSQ
jgi:hypothetical protein